MSLTLPLVAHARARPGATALVCGDTHLSWNDLHNAVEDRAAIIAAATSPTARIAIDGTDPMQTALGFLGAARAGRCAVLHDPAWPDAIRAQVVSALPADAALSALDICAVPDADDRPYPGDDAPLLIGFTSGSTGGVKGYQRTHGSWTRSVAAAQQVFQVAAEDIVCAPGGLSFSLFAFALVHGLSAGAMVRLAAGFRPADVLQAMHKDRTTVLYCVPTQAKALLDLAVRRGIALPDVRLILSSGQKWHAAGMAAAADVFPAADIAEFYGASETSFIAYRRSGDGAPDGSVGRAFPGVSVAVRDDAGTDVPPGTPGRIWVKSDLAFSGYVLGGAPECRRDGAWLTVGDHGVLDAGGWLTLTGREHRMLVTAGANLYPEVIEAALMTHPAIRHAAVLGLADDLRGQRVVAALALEAAAARPDRSALAEAVRDAAGAHAVPRAFHVLDDWPLARSGKTDFAAIQALLNSDPSPPTL